LNAFIVIPNERIFQIVDQKTPIREAFSAINKILTENLEGLIEMLFLPGVINIDFADLKTILAGKGKIGFLNTVVCEGENRAEEAAKKILESPLYEYGILGAERILFNISGSKNLAMAEVEEISRRITDFNKKAKIIFGISQVESLKNSLKIALLAIGCREKLEAASQKRKERRPPKISKLSRKPSKNRKPIAEKIKVGEAKLEKPLSLPEPKEEERIEIKTRRNALEVKKELEKAEQEQLIKETQWETPAFLRKKH
jgi:cell division protein FtsZ